MTTTDSSQLIAADRKLTGICAVLVAALSLVMVPLYFVYSGPPPADNVLARNLTTVVVFTVFLVFTTGLRRLLAAAGLVGDIASMSGLVYAAMTLVAASLECGVALQYPDGSKDPTIDGPLANGMALLHGPIARLLVATFLLALAVAVLRTWVLPGWVRTGSILLAIVNLAFVPSLFFGMNPEHFYAANGWGSTASIGMVNMLWIGAIGVAILRDRHDHADVRSDQPAATIAS
jgi:type IV secretory pathway VirB2 component (pilin)